MNFPRADVKWVYHKSIDFPSLIPNRFFCSLQSAVFLTLISLLVMCISVYSQNAFDSTQFNPKIGR